ncbi:MAG: class I SAM-dependent methyltransferase [Bauldia sp.]|uniref:class I SAM-dependent methyltransferase n=1 Tax=Bauldia sp. TaxID=2575872 RepID=UPI001D4C6777|nr:class I SAM-dependent methyltransferase [Bauldia sp.]MCB1494522.1 class I SAM-dependent methyltransferase [Bauldia sp.]
MSRGSIGLSKRLNDYIVGAHTAEHPVLTKLREETASLPQAEMQIAPEQGHFLAFLVRLIGARTVLEVGTFTGYSALAVALALPADGRLVACDVSEEWTSIGKRHWLQAGMAERIELRIAPALETLEALKREGMSGRFDMAFVDAQKSEYDAYYEACLGLVRLGGLITFDNMLMSGDVAEPGAGGKGVAAVRALNARIATDPRVDAVLLPVGDGMTLARRVA